MCWLRLQTKPGNKTHTVCSAQLRGLAMLVSDIDCLESIGSIVTAKMLTPVECCNLAADSGHGLPKPLANLATPAAADSLRDSFSTATNP